MAASNINDLFKEAYANPTVERLLQLLIQTYEPNALLISWYIGNSYWYIPVIYFRGFEDGTPSLVSTYRGTEDGTPSLVSLYRGSEVDRSVGGTPSLYTMDEPGHHNTALRQYPASELRVIRTRESKIIYYRSDTTTPNDSRKVDPFVIHALVDRIAMEDLLKRQKFRRELTLSNISHSIRNPLNGIIHMTKAIMDNGHIDYELKEYLEYLNKSTVSLANNIFDIIDLTKLELGKLLVNKEVFNLRELVHGTAEIAKNLNKSKHVIVDYHIDKSVPEYIYSDPKRIKQILINLLENSIQYTTKGQIFINVSAIIVDLATENGKHTGSDTQIACIGDNYNRPDESKIQPEVEPSSYAIVFTIRDTGCGIDEKLKYNLFKPIDIISTKQQGMGLSISYLLARALNGTLKLTYSERSIGTCFEFTLVACEEEPPSITSNTMRSLKDKSVLLLDEIGNRIEICKVFEKFRMRYVIAGTCEEILILHKDKKFDLIIVQLRPEIPEIEVSKLLFNIYKNTPTLVIADKISKYFNYSLNNTYEEYNFKTKLIEIFSGTAKYDNIELNLLVVEEEQVDKIVIERILRELGYNSVTIANNAEDAITIYRNNRDIFNVVLIGVRLSIMSGFELADTLHNINPNIKLLGISAQLVLDGDLRPWFNEFVYKPIDAKELHKKITSVR
jgi:signal transduction histidine kinase